MIVILLFGVLDSLPKRLQLEGGWHEYVLDMSVAAVLLVPLWYVGRWQANRLAVSVKQYRDLVESSPYCTLVLIDDRIVFANQEAAQLLQAHSPEELLGRGIWEFSVRKREAAADECLAAFRQAWISGKVESVIVDLQGVLHDISGRGSWIDWQGQRAMLSVFQDVTVTKSLVEDRRRAREEIERLSLHNDLILQTASDGIFGVDFEGRMIFINPAGARMLGYEPSELIGLYSHEMFHHSNANGDPCSSKESRIQISMRELRIESKSDEVFWRKDDTSFPVEYSSVPVLWQGTVAGAIVTFRDITERKNTEELMRRSDTLSVVGQLAAGIAHEIRNPLTTLRGLLQLLLADETTKSKAPYYEVMLSELDRINFIVGELMMLVKPRALSFEQQDVRVILQKVVFLLKAQANLHNVDLRMEFDEQMPLVTCEESKLKQVFINVLKNAIEAMPHGGEIVIGVQMLGEDEVRVTVQDHGVGIPEIQLSKIGQPFHTTKESGTGLGLTVSWKIIEDHRGTFRIHSREGVGTTVEITLPVLQTAQDVAL
ncbi:PAS domain S-box protein [Tumebacillus flagellatus]|uniref:histidine kinase n=1 Tax=Tumebacillus flagellatus TaxID=1157490 RepID=A0A074LW56_9BACL|nr:PAS domain S-box protein [Tumebacillus flagellatus]KEO84820.1 hypothetical protein EL26_02075 [Tumebacillus flagellatus]